MPGSARRDLKIKPHTSAWAASASMSPREGATFGYGQAEGKTCRCSCPIWQECLPSTERVEIQPLARSNKHRDPVSTVEDAFIYDCTGCRRFFMSWTSARVPHTLVPPKMLFQRRRCSTNMTDTHERRFCFFSFLSLGLIH